MARPIFSILAGAIAIIGGFLALANPLAATLTAEVLAGWFFIAIGILELVSAFRRETWGGTIFTAILGLVYIFAGVSLLGNPLAGIVSLTVVVAIMFLVGGIARIAMGFSLGAGQFWLLIVSGIISLILAFMIFSNFPVSAVATLGILLGVELLASGVSLVALGFAGRQAEQ